MTRMTPNGSHAWRPQRPGSDFADRTVAAILGDGVERRRMRRPRRLIATLAMAAALVAAGAWAWTATPRTSKSALPPPNAAPTLTRVDDDRPVVGPPSVAPELSADPPLPPMPAAPPVRHKQPAPSGKSLKLKLPRCSCMQTICDCVEEP